MISQTPGPDELPSGAAGAPFTTAPQFRMGYARAVAIRPPVHLPADDPPVAQTTPGELVEFGSSMSNNASSRAEVCPLPNEANCVPSTLLVMLVFRKTVIVY